MKTLQWLEVFASLQGEGLRVGVPSVFVRMFGCNFRCQGFGMEDGKLSDEYQKIDVKQYSDLKDLPLVKTGCDSYAAWDPRCKHLLSKGTPDDLIAKIKEVYPDLNRMDIVITGGEPLLGWQKIYPELLEKLAADGIDYFTFETNGTQKLSDEMKECIERNDLEVIWSISPKLSTSGEPREKAIVPEAVKSLLDHGTAYFKFVVSGEENFEEIEEVRSIYKDGGVELPVYLMPVGGCIEEYKQTAPRVAEFCIRRNFLYSPRLHMDLFKNEWGT